MFRITWEIKREREIESLQSHRYTGEQDVGTKIPFINLCNLCRMANTTNLCTGANSRLTLTCVVELQGWEDVCRVLPLSVLANTHCMNTDLARPIRFNRASWMEGEGERWRKTSSDRQ